MLTSWDKEVVKEVISYHFALVFLNVSLLLLFVDFLLLEQCLVLLFVFFVQLLKLVLLEDVIRARSEINALKVEDVAVDLEELSEHVEKLDLFAGLVEV